MNNSIDNNDKILAENQQKVLLARVDGKYALDEFLNLIGYEKGFLFTVAELLLRPSKLIHHYLNTNRNACTKPVTFLILCSVVYSLITSSLKVDVFTEEQLNQQFRISGVSSVMLWVQDNYGYANILMLVFIALWTKIFFKKQSYNIYEIGVLLCFVIGECMLLFTIHPLFTKFVTNTIFDTILYGGILIYTAWSIGQFFGGGFKNYFKAIIAYLFGFLTFEIIAIIVGLAIDAMAKKL